MCVCKHVCMYVLSHVCMYVCVYVCMYIRVYVCLLLVAAQVRRSRLFDVIFVIYIDVYMYVTLQIHRELHTYRNK